MLTERQEELLAQIETIVLAEGFADLTVGDLAKRLHCSRRSLYELSPSKDGLFARAVTRIYQRRLMAAKTAVFDTDAPEQRLAIFFEGVRERNEDREERFIRDVSSNPEVDRGRQLHIRAMLDLLEVIIRDGVGRGSFQPVHSGLAVSAAFAVFNMVTNEATRDSLGLSYDEAFQGAVVLVTRSLGAPDPVAAVESSEDERPA